MSSTLRARNSARLAAGAEGGGLLFRLAISGQALIGWLLVLLLVGAWPSAAYEGGRTYPTQATHPPIPAIRIAEPAAGRTTVAPTRVMIYFQRFEQDLVGSSVELYIDGVEYSESLRFWVDRAWLDLPRSFGWSLGHHIIAVSVRAGDGSTLTDSMSFELMGIFAYPWPFDYGTPNVVANLLEDYQLFDDSEPYWHHGLDLRAPQNAVVRASIGGYVAYAGDYPPPSELRWNVTVLGDDDSVWQYSHIVQADVETRTVGQRVEQGDILGRIVDWPTSENAAFYHHLHLNVAEHEDVDVVVRLQDERDVVAGLTQNPDGQPFRLGVYDLADSIEPVATPCGLGWYPKTSLYRFDVVPGEYDGSLQDLLLLDVFQRIISWQSSPSTCG